MSSHDPTDRRLARLQQLGIGPVWLQRGETTSAAATVGSLFEQAATGSEEQITSGTPVTSAQSNTESVGEVAAPMSAAHSDDAIANMDWPALQAAVNSCTRCALCRSRTHAVLGAGDFKAGWLFVGEGPGQKEDMQGQPFIGPAGKLLDNMLLAIDLRRGENTYIANIVKCRPTDANGRDRAPTAEESAACRPYLERQIALLKPVTVVALGKVAALTLLGAEPNTALATLRSQQHHYRSIPLVVTYHPAYLLRKPIDKAKSWQDLCLARQAYRSAGKLVD